jgi:hypothetical protein
LWVGLWPGAGPDSGRSLVLGGAPIEGVALAGSWLWGAGVAVEASSGLLRIHLPLSLPWSGFSEPVTSRLVEPLPQDFPDSQEGFSC